MEGVSAHVELRLIAAASIVEGDEVEEIDALSGSQNVVQNQASINNVSFRAQRGIGSAAAGSSPVPWACNGVDPSPSPIIRQTPRGMEASVRDDTSRGQRFV